MLSTMSLIVALPWLTELWTPQSINIQNGPPGFSKRSKWQSPIPWQ